MTQAQVLLFGDQVVDRLPSLRQLYKKSRTRPQLRQFLRGATDIVRTQVSTLTLAERKRVGNFSDLLELGEFHAQQKHPDEISGAVLITAIQIGELLLLSDRNPSILQERNVYQLGFCVGGLAAAIASAASDTSEVIAMGVEAVAISFRLGRELERRARLIQDTDDSWGCTLVGSLPEPLQKRLDTFNSLLPSSNRLYLGIMTESWSTAFGPPSTLRMLDGSSDFDDLSKSPLKAAIAVHAPHLSQINVDSVLGDSPILDKALRRQSCVSLSASSLFKSDTLRGLIYEVICEVAQQPLVVHETIRSLGQLIKKSGVERVQLITVGPTPHTNMTRSLLQKQIETAVLLTEGLEADGAEAGDEDVSGLVAIVGMSGRFPQSNSLDEFWNILENGIDTHEEIPLSRFPIDHFYDEAEERKNSTKTRFGCFLKDPGLFDNRLFNISPREALQMDPLQRMLLMTTYEALEMAGYSGSDVEDRCRVATYFGQTTEDWRTINDQQGCDTHYLTCSNRAFAPGRVAHHFKWGGGFYSVDTACSSSSTSLYLACNALTSGECDMGVVGGGSLLMLPELYSGLSRGGFLSSTGGCKTYADAADGYCRGEAVGVVIVKRLQDAIRNNDNVLAVVRGAARNSNAGAGSITYPGEDAQVALFERLLRQSGLDASQVSFIEMHGTGTQVGDRVEMSTVQRVFAQSRSPANPLYVGAVKGNVGHSEAAAGVVSLIKSVLMLQRDRIPPQPGYPYPLNRNFSNLEVANIKIASGQPYSTEWARGNSKRRLVINGFDAAGGNTSILVEDGPVKPLKQADPRKYHVVACSARTPASLAANKARLAAFLLENQDINLAHLAYTTTARRMHDVLRESFVVDSVSSLVQQLQNILPAVKVAPKARNPSLTFVFTGQGSRYTGMGSILYNTSQRFRRTLDDFEALCKHNGLVSWIDIIRGTQDVSDATPTQLQLVMVALEVALAYFWQSLGLQPGLVVGHSLGEYAALCVAGVISPSDMFYLVHKRAVLMEQRCEMNQYSMLAVPMAVDASGLLRLLGTSRRSSCEVACVNGPSLTVISGLWSEIDEIAAELRMENIATTRLQVPYGFHSAQMESLVADFEAAAKPIHFAKPTMAVVSTLTGALEDTFDATYFARQMRQPVNFLGAMKTCEAEGLIGDGSLVLEIGPHPVGLSLMANCLPEVEISGQASLYRGQDDWKSVCSSIAAAYQAKLPINWREFHEDHIDSVSLVDLPTYAFDLRDFWVSFQIQDQSPAIVSAPPTHVASISSTTLQSVEHLAEDKSSAVFASYTSEPYLLKAIQGHIVDGAAICPAAVFVDMAYTAAKYLLDQNGVKVQPESLEIADLNMISPLVVTGQDASQTVRVLASLEANGDCVQIRFKSTASGLTKEHAACAMNVRSSAGWQSEWSRMQRLMKGRVDHLIGSSATGTAHRMSKALMYKLFASLVDYSSSYQSLEEVHIDHSFDDATGRMQLSPINLGTFTYSPYSVDALVHLAGFLLNGDLKRQDEDVHIANRIGRMQIVAELKNDRTLTCYAAVRERTSKGMSLCDVYVFDDHELVAYCVDVRFQKLTRSVFASLVGKKDPMPNYAIPKVKQSSQTLSRHASDSSEEEEDSAMSDAGSGSGSSHTSAETLDVYPVLLEIIADRTGASLYDIGPETTFTALGVDSQMSIAILSDFKRRVGMELPAAFFTNFSSIAEVKEELGSPNTAQPTAPVPSVVRTKKPEEVQPKKRAPSKAPPAPSGGKSANKLLGIVAAELGIDMDELSPSTNFASAGVDSMISIKILSKFQKETGVELPAAFFNNFQSVSEAREELDGPSPNQTKAAATVTVEEITTKAHQRQAKTTTQKAPESAPVRKPEFPQQHTQVSQAPAKPKPKPESRAILIQGKTKSKEAPLFLVTDGSGAVAAYIHLPALPNGRRIYALESPFLERPQDYNISIQEMAQVFIESIRKIQPRGPYLIGGWSAGSIYAYEISWQLATVWNEQITGLMILDMRVPHSVPDASEVTMAFVEKTGAFTGVERAGSFLQGLSDRQKMHLTSTVRALIRYDPTPFPEGKRPLLTHVIWATKGLNDSPNPEEHDERITGPAAMGPCGDGREMTEMSMEEFELELKSWFFAKRYDFGTNGWEDFVGDSIEVRKVDGDHFSMVAPPVVKDLGGVVLEAVKSYAEL
ncbi:BcPKS15, polyketide synthase [Xylaria intraflava]|nr:BcPKS15, polyketide synthase [Xylaria intraflava]